MFGIEAILLLLNELNETKTADTSEISTEFNRNTWIQLILGNKTIIGMGSWQIPKSCLTILQAIHNTLEVKRFGRVISLTEFWLFYHLIVYYYCKATWSVY